MEGSFPSSVTVTHPKASSAVAPKLAPITPVRTTMAIAKEGSAPISEQMAMASGEVMLRDSAASRSVVGRPSNLHSVRTTNM